MSPPEDDYDLQFVEGRVDDEIERNTVVWCCGLQRLMPWFAVPLEKEYQDAMRWRYANRLRASMIFLSVFFMTFVGYEYVHGTDRFYVSGFARVVCAFFALLLALSARSVMHGGFLATKWRYELFSSFVIMFATGTTMALAVIDQDMRPPVDMVIVMTGMYGIAAAPFARLSSVMIASTLVWTFYLVQLGSVYKQELYASLITLWVINAMGMFRSWQAEVISRKEVFGESKRLAEESTIATIGKREEKLVRSFVPGFMQSTVPGQTQAFENVSFALVQFPFFEELLSSEESILMKRQRLTAIMVVIDIACRKWDIRRVWTHGEFMAFVANVATTRCTGHAPMFCAMSEITYGLTDLCDTLCVASISAGPVCFTLIGSMCRTVLIEGSAYNDALECFTQPDVLEYDESMVYATQSVRSDVIIAMQGRQSPFDGTSGFHSLPCEGFIATSMGIENYVQSRPRSTAWKQFSLLEDDPEEDGILMMEFESSDGADDTTLGWSMQQRQSVTDVAALLVDRSHGLRKRQWFMKEMWQRFGFERSYRIVNARGFQTLAVSSYVRKSGRRVCVCVCPFYEFY